MPQAITTDAIKAYCDFFRVDSQQQRESLYRIVRRLDAVYLKTHVDRRNKEIDNLKKPKLVVARR